MHNGICNCVLSFSFFISEYCCAANSKCDCPISNLKGLALPRGSKDLKNYTGSVNFFKPWYVTLLPKIDMSDRKRQFQEKHIAFLVLKKWEKYENISVCLCKLQKGIFGTQLV